MTFINKKLYNVISEEQSIFKKFSQYKEISNQSIAYYTSGSNQIPHWNMVYSTNENFKIPQSDLKIAANLYEQNGLYGHFMSIDHQDYDLCNELSEYFAFSFNSESSFKTSESIYGFEVISNNDLRSFVYIIQQVFNLDANTTSFFYKKMDTLAHESGSKFWIISYKNKMCGVASTFQTDRNNNFLFNVGILPEFQKLGLGHKMINYCVNQCNSDVYTYSHNPIMRNHILPNAGFQAIGKTYVVPINKIHFDKNNIFRGPL